MLEKSHLILINCQLILPTDLNPCTSTQSLPQISGQQDNQFDPSFLYEVKIFLKQKIM